MKKRIVVNTFTNLTDDEYLKLRVKLLSQRITVGKWFDKKVREEINH